MARQAIVFRAIVVLLTAAYLCSLLIGASMPLSAVRNVFHSSNGATSGSTSMFNEDSTLDCSFATNSSLLAQLVAELDIFFCAHVLGWLVKAYLYPNIYVLLASSFAFELLEVLLDDILINFRECWWDRWILDFLFCNTIGILTGLWLVKRFETRSLQQAYYSSSTLSHWVVHAAAVYFLAGLDVNAFLLKAILMKTDHILHPCRLLLVAVLGFYLSRYVHNSILSTAAARTQGSAIASLLIVVIGIEFCFIAAHWEGISISN